MDEKHRKRIERFCQRRGYRFEWQKLKFGFQRAMLTFSDSESYTKAQTEAFKLPETHANWNCFYEGEFEGFIYLMHVSDYEALQGKLQAEAAGVNDWWQRYHNADPETRKKMACGEIP